jgi:hypothetical protein
MKAFRVVLALLFVLCIPRISAAASVAHVGGYAPVDKVSLDILSRQLTTIQQRLTVQPSVGYTIHQNFPQLVEQNFAALDPQSVTTLFDHLSEKELADLAQLYTTAISDAGRPSRLLAVLAIRMDGVRLGRASKHFGFGPVYEAVNANAPSKSQEFLQASSVSYAAPLPGASLVPSKSMSAHAPQENASVGEFLNYTPYEIYLSFRTAPIGALGPVGALYESAALMSGALVGSFTTGWAIGTALDPLIQEYAPSTWDAIGGTINQIIENMWTAPKGTPANGAAEGAGAQGFGVSADVYGDLSGGGDYEVTSDWADYGGGSSGGGCGVKAPAGSAESFYSC